MTSQKKGTPGVRVLFDTPEGEIEWTGWLSDGALEITLKALRAMGWQGDDLDDLSTVGSLECDVVTAFETYKDNDYLKVKFVNALGSTQMAGAKKQRFAEQMRGKIRALASAAPELAIPAKVATGATPAGTAAVLGDVAPPPTNVDDSDIPF
jgi:hypothetical protein